jgi:putative DNA primase/helicase
MRRAKASVLGMFTVAMQADDTARKAMVRWALKSQQADRLRALVALAASEPGIPLVANDLDADRYVLNVENGLLDFRRAELRPHTRDSLCTKLAPVRFDTAATAPTWSAFLDRIFAGNTDIIAFMQKAVGYSLTGATGERVLFILYGTGCNGKSTFLEVVRRVLGDYAMATPTETLMEKPVGAIPNDVARLKGARFVTASETRAGCRLAEATIKQLTGGDTIPARFMRAEFFEFRPEFKLWLATNHRPVIRNTDRAIWDRIRLVPFVVRIPDKDIDRELGAKLAVELPGILGWAVEGCRRWLTEGLGMVADVASATASYRRDSDLIGQFIEDECTIGDGHVVTSKMIYDTYRRWCEGEHESPVPKQVFGEVLGERGLEPGKGAKGVRIWRGIALRKADSANALGDDPGGAGGTSLGSGSTRARAEDISGNPRHLTPPTPPATTADPADTWGEV